jgi:hypothetical protein
VKVIRRVGPRRTTPRLSEHPLNQGIGVRKAWIGQVQHAAITRLALEHHPGERPSRAAVNAAVHPFFVGMPTPTVRGAKVEAMGGVTAWIRYQWPPQTWRLLGVEADLSPGGRSDLWWQPGTSVVADEIKTASQRRSAWATQLQSQLALGSQQWGNGFLGIRVFLTGDWSRSLWLPRQGSPQPLAQTAYWFPGQRSATSDV